MISHSSFALARLWAHSHRHKFRHCIALRISRIPGKKFFKTFVVKPLGQVKNDARLLLNSVFYGDVFENFQATESDEKR